MSYNFLDKTGLTYFWSKIKAKFDSFSRNDLAVIDSREYSGIYGSANDQANASFYFGGIKPNNYYDVWKVKFRVYSNVPNQNEYKQYSDVEYYGSKNDLSYKIYNRMANTGGRCYYYHNVCRLSATGFNAGYKHILGMGLRSSNNSTSSSYPRYFRIELLETDKCAFTFYDSMKKISEISEYNTTNYSGISEYDGCNNGLRESGDDTNIWQLRRNSGNFIVSTALYRYMICLQKNETTLIPMNAVNNSTATTKTLTTDSFNPFAQILYYNSTTTINANASVGAGALFEQIALDLRYSFNTGTTLTAHKDVYLVASPQSNGLAKLHTSPISQVLPTTADGLIYIYLGRAYSTYQIELHPEHPVYEFKNGQLREWTNANIPTKVSQLQNDTGFITNSSNIYESNLKYSNTRNIVADITPNDAGCIDEFGHNKLAFLPANCIDVEYTRDGGATWQDYEASDESKIRLVTTTGIGYSIGKKVTITSQEIASLGVRVTIRTRDTNGTQKIYTMLKKILMNVSTNGASGTAVKVETKTIGNFLNNVDTWSTYGTFNVSGWSGWNSLPVVAVFGGGDSQTTQIYAVRFTLTATGISSSNGNAQIVDIRAIGTTNWGTPSEMARAGHLYSMDAYQNATFPAKVTATGGFSGNLTGNVVGAVTKDLGAGVIADTNILSITGSTDGFKIDYGASTSDVGIAKLYTIDDGNAKISLGNKISSTYKEAISIVDGSATITGNLTGNVTGTASKATGDKNGADITTTYYKANNPNGYTSNTGTVTSVAVKMNGSTKGTVTTSGTIDLGTVITDISGKQDKLTAQTAYSAKGSATKVPQITTNALGQVTAINEVTITQPTVNNGTLTIQKNGTNVQTFTANQATNATANITVPTKVSELTNDKGYTTNAGTITGVSVNGTSIATSGVANIVTNTAYNATTNKIATMADISGGGITFDDVYPVGSIYMSMNSTDPGTLFGGTWVQIVNQFLFGAGQGYSAGDTGGEATHQLTKAELPNYDLYNASHSHNFTTYSGYGGRSGTMPAVNGGTNQGTFTATPNSATIKVSSGGSDTPHNNMPPYLVVYMWQRTA